jgi:hypothetical protein
MLWGTPRKPDHRQRRLLRARGERPRPDRAADAGDELRRRMYSILN